MLRPTKPTLTGIYRSPNGRFAFDFDRNPSPMRAKTVLVPADPDTGGRHTMEAIPVLCTWCGQPYWPPWSVIQGCCSAPCREAQSQCAADKRSHEELVSAVQQALGQETPSTQLQELLGAIQQRLVEDATEEARARGDAGKSLVAGG